MLNHTFCKLIQRKTYTCLSHKFGIYFAYSGVIIILYSMFHFGEELLEWSRYQYELTFTMYHDNIVSRSFQHRLCSQVPIDVVYTWVNGSCPILLAELNKFKQSSDFNSSDKKESIHIPCNFDNCLLLPSLIASPLLSSNQTQDLQKDFEVQSAFQLNFAKYVLGDTIRNVTVLRFNSLDKARNLKTGNNSFNTTFTWFHVATDASAPQSERLSQALLLRSIPDDIKSDSQFMDQIPATLKEKLDWMHFSSEKGIALLWLNDRSVVDDFVDEKSNSSLKFGIKFNDKSVSVHSAYFVNVVHTSGDSDIVSRSRFEDNEELRYSLRSIEKFAPWVHHIYIVTNGQIPYWLNMESPHLTLVTHEEIFVNKSHLPTFSSPAIEAHLHRIPGLSDKFIYFNDDVMFAKEVWPEDFYTHSSGQKVYLTWPVPNCAEGCAPSWITDGYCDAACNVSECNWDGGDCTGSNVKAGVGVNHNFGGGGMWQNSWQNSFTHYCKPGCSNTWLADKFCDQACNSYECGFDAGDCGLGDYNKMFKLTSKLSNGTTYVLPPGKHVGYIEISKTFSKVTSANYEKNKDLRTAAVSNKYHVVTLVFDINANSTVAKFNVTGLPLNTSQTNADTENAISLLFQVKAFPSSNMTTNITEDEVEVKGDDEESKADAVSPKDDLPEIVIVDVPEDMKRPSIKRNKERLDVEIPISIDQINTTTLSKEIQEELAIIKNQYEEELLTSNGYKLKLFQLLEPHLKEPQLLSQENVAVLRLKGDRGLMKREGDIAKKSEDNVRDSLKENAHSHKRGDPGSDVRRVIASHPLLKLRKNVPDLHRKTLETLVNVEKLSDTKQSPANWSESIKTRKLQSLETNVDTQSLPDDFLPWERSKESFLAEVPAKKVTDQYTTTFRQRKLLDTFGDSLRFVSKLFNDRFGFTQRKVPAHMPHMIDKNVMTELQSKYPHEYDMTSSHRLRHSDDMQFAFSYFYFLMSEEREIVYSDIFDEVDTDGSGVLSDREIRLLSTRLFELPLTLQDLTSIEDAFKTCAWDLYGSKEEKLQTNLTDSENQTIGSYTQPTDGLFDWAVTENYYDKNMPLVTKEVLLNCPFVIELINKTFSGRKKYKYEEMDQAEIGFKMIRDNVSTVVGQLDDLRKNPKKFVCLNDNINHELEGASTIKAVIRDFYETLLPKQSQFELPYDYRNRFTNVKELKQWKKAHDRTLLIMHCLLGFLFICVIVSFFWERLRKLRRKYRYVLKRKSFLKFFSSKSARNPV